MGDDLADCLARLAIPKLFLVINIIRLCPLA